jgi:hypothetical protein
MLFDRVVEGIEKNKKIKEGGGHLGITYPLPRFSEQIPLIDKGQSIGFLAATGAGKSRIGRYLYVYTPYKFYKETGYKIKILLFPLEDNKEKVYRSLLCWWLFYEHNILISPEELTSKKRILPDFVLEKIKEGRAYFADLEDVVEFVDGIYTPRGIFDYCQRHAVKVGKVKTRVHTNKEGLEITEKYYVSDVHTIVVLDNMSNLDIDPDDGINSEREAMIKLAKYYVREKLCNFFNFTVVQIMQLSFDKEKQQFTHSGMTILSKLEPDLAGIGEAKVMARSMHLILGLFDPSKFELIHYPIPSKQDPDNCYRIDILGDRFRALKVLKNNDGTSGLRVGLLFNALAETIEELPLPKTPELANIYKSLTGKKIEIPKNPITFVDESIEEEPF